MKYAWEQSAKGMRIGEQRRIVCPYCNKDKSMVLTRNSKGVTAFCFRCTDKAEYTPIEVTIQDIKASEHNKNKLCMRTVLEECIPLEELHDGHPARLWLLNAGIDPATAPCKYHPQTFRAAWILPDAVLMRRVYDVNSPKYLLVSSSDSVLPVMYYRLPDVNTVVICEDVLSAYRIGEIDGVAGVSILGTNPTAQQVHVITSMFPTQKYIIWTDGDAGGDKGAYKLGHKMRSIGIKFSRIITARDPKMHSKEEIIKLLKEERCGLYGFVHDSNNSVDFNFNN